MSFLAAIIRVLARWLPDNERAEIGMELSDRANNPYAESATPPDPAPDAPSPDWWYVCNALSDVSTHVNRIEELLDTDRVFTFDAIRRAARELREMVDGALRPDVHRSLD